jgi:fatty acid amide hydrolase 2
MPLLRTLAGPDGADDSVRPAELGDPGAVALEGLRVRIGERRWARPLGRDVLAARDRATDALAAAGARVERIALPDPRRAVWPGAATLGDAGSASVLALLDEAGGPRPTVLGALRRDDPYTTPLRIMALLEPLYRRVPERQLRRAVAAGERFGAELTEAIGDGVLLHPPLAGPAPRHGRTTGRPFYFTSALAFNIAPVPVTQVPLGLGRGGLPVGIQVAAGPGRDHVAIAVALQLERALGGWSPPAAPR